MSAHPRTTSVSGSPGVTSLLERAGPLPRAPATAQTFPVVEPEKWVRLAVAGGFSAGVSYFTFSAVELPLPVALVLVCAFGPALAILSGGIYVVLRLHRPTVGVVVALVANIAAAVSVTMMLLSQIGYRELLVAKFGDDPTAGVTSPAYQAANGIQLGLDVAWDVFLVIGTFLFALNMWGHPRFGRSYAVIGILLAVGLLTLNIVTFPEPPADSHLVDLGPFVGLWYVAVTIGIARSLKWVRDRDWR